MENEKHNKGISLYPKNADVTGKTYRTQMKKHEVLLDYSAWFNFFWFLKICNANACLFF